MCLASTAMRDCSQGEVKTMENKSWLKFLVFVAFIIYPIDVITRERGCFVNAESYPAEVVYIIASRDADGVLISCEFHARAGEATLEFYTGISHVDASVEACATLLRGWIVMVRETKLCRLPTGNLCDRSRYEWEAKPEPVVGWVKLVHHM